MTLMQTKACALHRTGLTDAQIAARFGVCRSAITRRRLRARARLARLGRWLPGPVLTRTRHIPNVDPKLFS
jgi:predicted RNA polymerase sigma factor